MAEPYSISYTYMISPPWVNQTTVFMSNTASFPVCLSMATRKMKKASPGDGSQDRTGTANCSDLCKRQENSQTQPSIDLAWRRRPLETVSSTLRFSNLFLRIDWRQPTAQPKSAGNNALNPENALMHPAQNINIRWKN